MGGCKDGMFCEHERDQGGAQGRMGKRRARWAIWRGIGGMGGEGQMGVPMAASCPCHRGLGGPIVQGTFSGWPPGADAYNEYCTVYEHQYSTVLLLCLRQGAFFQPGSSPCPDSQQQSQLARDSLYSLHSSGGRSFRRLLPLKPSEKISCEWRSGTTSRSPEIWGTPQPGTRIGAKATHTLLYSTLLHLRLFNRHPRDQGGTPSF